MRRKRGLQLPVIRTATSRSVRDLWSLASYGLRRTLIDSNKVRAGKRSRRAGASQVGLGTVELLIGFLHVDGARDVVGIDANALFSWNALSGGMRRLRDARAVVLVRGRRCRSRVERGGRRRRALVMRVLHHAVRRRRLGRLGEVLGGEV